MSSLLFLLAALSCPLRAAELRGVSMPDSVKVGGKTLTLNGIATRQYSIFKVNVYVGALYLEEKSTDEKKILESKQLKEVRMHFLREGPAEGARDAWRDFLKANWDGEWEAIAPVAEKYLALIPDVKRDEEMTHDFYPDRVVVFLGEKRLGEVVDARFPALLLSTWIGRRPSTEDLKRGLLGRKED